MIDMSMKNISSLIAGSLGGLFSTLELKVHGSPEAEMQEIRKVIDLFVKAGDARDIDQLNTVLYSQFRVVANQLMGSAAINVISKNEYLALIREGKLGGDTRTLEILSLEIVGRNASAKVKVSGKTLTVESFYHLIQNNLGQWQLVQDLPFVTKN